MAESLAEPFVSFAVERLGDLLIAEYKFLRGVKVQVEQLQTELRRMRCFLQDADAKREEGNETVRNLVAEIREVAYDAEDAIEAIVIKVAFRKRMAGIFNTLVRCSCIVVPDCIALHKIGKEIESIKTKISSISTSLQTYGVRSMPEGEISSSRYERQRLLRQTYAHIMEEDVGLDDDLKIVVDHLLNEDYRGCQVVSIWGMGGIGKTTLAKKVYHHNDVKRYFDCRVWVYISQQCNPREVLEQILIELGSPSKEQREEIKALTHAELVKKIYEVQSEKKCLVILDDIWETLTWDLLVPAFRINKSNEFGSKILMTTRKRDVASYPDDGQRCFVHELTLLNEVQSWELFQKKATRNGETKLSAKMTKQGKEMVEHCGGLPLAIVVLGGLLATKYTLKEWEIVGNNLSYYLNKDRDKGVMNILALSYQDLPYHLKACFLYLSHLPEDREIRARKLVQMWMAEGIVLEPQAGGKVSQREEETMLDVGFRYLGELAQRSMVQVQLNKYIGKIKFCRLHDLMLEFCMSKTFEENFFKILHLGASSSSSSSLTSSSSSTIIRRIAFHYFDGRDVDSWETQSVNPFGEITNYHHIRSCLFYFEKRLTSSGWTKVKSLFRNFKLLRVLDHGSIECVDEMMLPREIGNLRHLRYLSVEGSAIIGLPSSIGNLLYLQTLNLRGKYHWYEDIIIPNVLWRLEQLRHLYLPYRIEGPDKLQLDGLSKLETLKGFNPKYCDVSCFATLTNLRKVEVFWAKPEDLAVILNHSYPHLRYSSFFITGDFQMGEGQRLLSQLLGYRHLDKLGIVGPLNQVTFAGQFASNLTALGLQGSNLEEDPMPTLEKLPNLVRLKMYGGSYIGKEMVCSAPTPLIPSVTNNSEYWSDECRFPRLKYLCLSEIPNLEEWRIEDGAMPNLLELVILSCPKLKQIPNGLKSITTMQKLEIGGESMLRDRLRGGGEDFYKVQHLLSIDLSGPDSSYFFVDE